MTDKDTARLYVVATPIGNLEDITLRAARILGEVDILAAEDTRSVKVLLDRHGIRAKSIVSYFTGNEAQRSEELVAAIEAGKTVAVVSEAGMPGISDPGQRLVSHARARNVPVEVIPGASAVITALVGSGLPSDRFYFVGFPPRAKGERQQLFAELRSIRATLIFYESPERTGETLGDLAAAMGGEREAALARELTKMYEEFALGTLAELADRYREKSPRGEVTLVVRGADETASASEESIEAQVRALLDEGLGPKDVAARLVITTGKPKRQLYQLALSLKRESSR